MAIDVGKLAADMAAAASGVFRQKWPTVSAYAEGAFRDIAATAADIEQKYRAGEISKDEAQTLLDMQRDAAGAVLLAVKGMTDLMVEQALNAAINVVKDAVNTALGFPLL